MGLKDIRASKGFADAFPQVIEEAVLTACGKGIAATAGSVPVSQKPPGGHTPDRSARSEPADLGRAVP